MFVKSKQCNVEFSDILRFSCAAAVGLHLLYILWRNRLVRGCPYEVNVSSGSSSGAAASSVTCSGDGLREGVVSPQFRVLIDASRAAPGLIQPCDFEYQLTDLQIYSFTKTIDIDVKLYPPVYRM